MTETFSCAWIFKYIDGYQLIFDAHNLPKLRKWGIRVETSNINGRQDARGRGEYLSKPLARLITEAPEGLYVDHKNGNRLDNREANLRLVTPQQNAANAKPNWNKKLPKGVYAVKNNFRARIGKEGKHISLGTFLTVEEADAAYKKAAEKLHGEYAFHISRKL